MRERPRMLTRSRRIRAAFDSVWRRLSPSSRQKINDVVGWVVARSEWRRLGINGLNPESAGLYPLLPLPLGLPVLSERTRAIWYDLEGRPIRPAIVRFHLPVCRLLSDQALRGVVAHELAHAARAFRVGAEWHDTFQARYDKEETAADRLAALWGFATEIRTLRRERRTIVNPWIDAHAWKIQQRAARREELIAERFGWKRSGSDGATLFSIGQGQQIRTIE